MRAPTPGRRLWSGSEFSAGVIRSTIASAGERSKNLMTQAEVETWLHAETPDALALQRPLPDEALRIVAKDEREDRAAVLETFTPSWTFALGHFVRFR